VSNAVCSLPSRSSKRPRVSTTGFSITIFEGSFFTPRLCKSHERQRRREIVQDGLNVGHSSDRCDPSGRLFSGQGRRACMTHISGTLSSPPYKISCQLRSRPACSVETTSFSTLLSDEAGWRQVLCRLSTSFTRSVATGQPEISPTPSCFSLGTRPRLGYHVDRLYPVDVRCDGWASVGGKP